MDEQRITGETGDKNAVIDRKLRQFFDGKIVRKDLTKKIKEGANVPVYVLEFLLGQYCSSDDPEVIETGVENVKRILADNYVRPDEAQKILSMLRQRGMHTVIDKITVNLNMKKDTYEAEFSNLGIKNIPISEDYPAKFDRLLCGGIWCIVQLEYEFLEEEKNAWDEAVGECFAEGMFDTFWKSQERIYFLGASDVNDCQTSVKEIELVETNDNIQHINSNNYYF